MNAKRFMSRIPLIAGLMGLSASTAAYGHKEIKTRPTIWTGRPRGIGGLAGRAWRCSSGEYARDPKTGVLTRRRPRRVKVLQAIRAAKKRRWPQYPKTVPVLAAA